MSESQRVIMLHAVAEVHRRIQEENIYNSYQASINIYTAKPYVKDSVV